MDQITTIRNTLRSGYHEGTHVTSNGICLTEDIRGETGRVYINGTIDRGVSAEIKFKKDYVDPVVVAYIITRRGGQSIEVRVTDVTFEGCTIFLEEPDDENHMPEDVGYIVMEAGSHITASGYRIEAGVHETYTARKAGDINFEGDEIKFEKIFKSTPAVLHTLNTYNGKAFITSMAQNVDATKFELAQELAETKKKSVQEKIGWIAFENMVGKGNFTDVKGEVGIVTASVPTGVDNRPGTTIRFNAGFNARPDIVVKGQTMRGGNGYWARGAGAWSKDLIRVYAEEDQRRDKERWHVWETFGYAAFEENSILRTTRAFGERTSDIINLGNITIRVPIIATWKTNNYACVGVELKFSANYGTSWSEWLPVEYALPVPGLPVTGDLDGYQVQFKFILKNDVDVPVNMTEFRIESADMPIVIEGMNIGGYAQDGTEWNRKRII